MNGLALVLLPALLLGQTTPVEAPKPDPRELLLHSGDAIKKYKSYQIHSLTIIETRGGLNNRMQMPTVISVRRPDRMRIESENEAAGMTVVSDGDHTWISLLPQNKYIKRAAASSPESSLGETDLLKNLPDIAKSIQSVKLTDEKTMELDGETFDCWVIETRYDSIDLPDQQMSLMDAVQINWISKKLGLTLQNSFTAKLMMGALPEPVRMTQATTTMELKLDPDLPDSLFVFTPSEDAKETADWTLPGVTKPDVVGKPTPAFKGKSLDGAAVDLASLRGKVVLLDFWTTWCVPCKRELPMVEKIHREFQGKGLVVMGVTAGEEQSTVEEFLKTAGLTHPVLPLTAGDDLLRKLAISAYPTIVLLDREGKVATYEIGARGEAALRADLAKLGIGSPDGKSGVKD